MGNGEDGQPLLIYAHHDTSNHHIHIVTSRINPQGKKIDHDNERLRSQAVINNIMGVKPKQDVKNIVQKSLRYSYETLGPVSYTHLTLPTKLEWCRSRWSPYH